jgi:cbb3-type cytochrome oxidase subunit 3
MKLNFLKNGNWGLKLLALILALIIYHTLKPAAKTSNSQFRINLPHDEQKPQ